MCIIYISLEYIKTHKESQQIQKDIDRSLNSFEVCKKYDKATK
jgi:hypothetical protein